MAIRIPAKTDGRRKKPKMRNLFGSSSYSMTRRVRRFLWDLNFRKSYPQFFRCFRVELGNDWAGMDCVWIYIILRDEFFVGEPKWEVTREMTNKVHREMSDRLDLWPYIRYRSWTEDKTAAHGERVLDRKRKPYKPRKKVLSRARGPKKVA